jgi:conjugative transfer pilus assembly protein TraH
MGKLRTQSRFARALRIAVCAGVSFALTAGGPLQASVDSELKKTFDDAGVAANITGPTAFQGQAAGYYSLGNIYTRFPNKTVTPASITLPSIKAGCGGIDLFAGGFSFISADQFVALAKAVANNAIGFAFDLALTVIDSQIAVTMQKIRDLANKVNEFNINSCEAAQKLVDTVGSSIDTVQEKICASAAANQGRFKDNIEARWKCANPGTRTSVLEGITDPGQKDSVPLVKLNYTWSVLSKSGNGLFADDAFKELVMNMVGTVLTSDVAESGSSSESQGSIKFIAPNIGSLYSALLDGTAGVPVPIMSCDEKVACLNLKKGALSVSNESAFRPRIRRILASIVENIRTDTALNAEQRDVVAMSTIPVYKILAVSATANLSGVALNLDALAEVVAINLVQGVIEQLLNGVSSSVPFLKNADPKSAEQWRSQIEDTRTFLSRKDTEIAAKVSAAQQFIDRAIRLESTLQNVLSPRVSAALNFSRGLSSSASQ